MSDLLRPDQRDESVSELELHRSAMLGSACGNPSVASTTSQSAAQTQSLADQPSVQEPVQHCGTVEADEGREESGTLGELPPIEAGLQRRPMAGPRKGRRLVRREDSPRAAFTAEQRLLILDSWQRSGLPARDFAPLVGLSKHTLYAWKKPAASSALPKVSSGVCHDLPR